MPSLLVYKLSIAEIELGYTLDLVVTVLLGLCIVFFTLIVINIFLQFNNRAFTSIVQGGIRFNTYVFLAFVDSIYGDSGLVIAALLIAFVIPFINVMCISMFAIYVKDGQFSFISFFKTVVKNPLILACLVGGLINIGDVSIPIIALVPLSILSSAALPIGLLCVGVGLEFNHIKLAKKELFISSLAKLVYLPMVIYMIGLVFGLSSDMLAIAVLFAAMPTAVSSYILARELGGDTKMMASIITFQTLLCIATLFLVFLIL